MELLTVRLDLPEDANVILGQAHFIKTAEDLCTRPLQTLYPARKSGWHSERPPGRA